MRTTPCNTALGGLAATVLGVSAAIAQPAPTPPSPPSPSPDDLTLAPPPPAVPPLHAVSDVLPSQAAPTKPKLTAGTVAEAGGGIAGGLLARGVGAAVAGPAGGFAAGYVGNALGGGAVRILRKVFRRGETPTAAVPPAVDAATIISVSPVQPPTAAPYRF